MPTGAELETLRVSWEVPEPGAAMLAGTNVAVTPAGAPLAESDTAELKPPETAVVTVALPLRPCLTESEVGETEMVKLPEPGAVTLSVTVVV